MKRDTVEIPRVLAIDYLAQLNHRISRLTQHPLTYGTEARIEDLRARMRTIEDALGVTLKELLEAVSRSRQEVPHA